MKKILVIGGTGMLGKPVAEQLAQYNFEVAILSRKVKPNSYFSKNIQVVTGDVDDANTLNKLLLQFDALHINLSGAAETKVPAIVRSAQKNGIQLITYISGITVNKKNTGFESIGVKYANEQSIISSGIPYAIFKPTWFMESLPLYINKSRAAYFGKQEKPIAFIAAADYASMVLQVYTNALATNQSYKIVGPTAISFQNALTTYIKTKHQEIKQVSSTPYFIGNCIAALSGNKQLKQTVAFMKYFEQATEDESSTYLSGTTTLQQWLHTI